MPQRDFVGTILQAARHRNSGQRYEDHPELATCLDTLNLNALCGIWSRSRESARPITVALR